jgi:hypothetical protein
MFTDVADGRKLPSRRFRRSRYCLGCTFCDITQDPTDRIALEFTIAEAKLIVAARRQFEPFWPSDMDDMGRAELLAGIRQGIEHVTAVIDPANAPVS